MLHELLPHHRHLLCPKRRDYPPNHLNRPTDRHTEETDKWTKTKRQHQRHSRFMEELLLCLKKAGHLQSPPSTGLDAPEGTVTGVLMVGIDKVLTKPSVALGGSPVMTAMAMDE